MSLADLAQRPVTYYRWTTTGTDPYNNPTYGHVADADTTLVWLEQTRSDEVTADEDTQLADWLLVDPNPDAGLTGRDQVDVDGTMFRVVGPPHIAYTPRGPHHLEARLAYVSPQ